jgi:uncharacterized protein (TIGR03437 family)
VRKVLASLLLLAAVASGHYAFVVYDSRGGSYTPVARKFDLSMLPGRTVQFFISDAAPQLLPGDSVASLHSQIRLAAEAWNRVDTSDLRLAFGGVRAAGAPAGNVPSIEVMFDDLPPGTLGYGGPQVFEDSGAAAAQAFVPILRSVVTLPRNFNNVQTTPCPCPSFSEAFFGTLVHEFGHTLGLQHSMTSGAMATSITRATTKSRPLSADDVAGISTLYPTRAFKANFGSISGRVAAGDAGIAYASVVAMAPSGAAVSGVAGPDGTYHIDGIPPGQYLIYAQPIPPPLGNEAFPGGMIPAQDADRRNIEFGGYFDTQFYPGTREFNFATPVQVRPASVVEGINFNVTRRSNITLHSVQIYAYPGQVAVQPGFVNTNVNPNEPRNYLVAYGAGLNPNNQLAPGLQIRAVGGAANVSSTRLHPFDARFVQMFLAFNPFANEGANHLVFQTPNEVYVQPSAFWLVPRPPPQISSVNATAENGVRLIVVSGAGLSAETRILVDGVTAAARSFDEAGQRLTVVAPSAWNGHRAAVVALNPDGQSSLFLTGNQPLTLALEGNEGLFVANPSGLPAGTEAMVEITGVNTSFLDGQISLGFGSSDVVVRRVWVGANNRILANVLVSPSAAAGTTSVTLVSGLQQLPVSPFTIQPANSRQLSLSPAGAASGGAATVQLHGPAVSGAVTVTLNDRPVPGAALNGNAVTFAVPAGLAPGPLPLRVTVGNDVSLPILFMVEPPPPQIIAAAAQLGANIDANRPARPGETIVLSVAGLGDAASANRILINVGGIEHTPQQVQAVNGFHQVTFAISPNVPSGIATTTVAVDGRTSAPFALVVRTQ